MQNRNSNHATNGKIATGKIPNSVGFSGHGGGGVIFRPEKKIEVRPLILKKDNFIHMT